MTDECECEFGWTCPGCRPTGYRSRDKSMGHLLGIGDDAATLPGTSGDKTTEEQIRADERARVADMIDIYGEQVAAFASSNHNTAKLIAFMLRLDQPTVPA